MRYSGGMTCRTMHNHSGAVAALLFLHQLGEFYAGQKLDDVFIEALPQIVGHATATLLAISGLPAAIFTAFALA